MLYTEFDTDKYEELLIDVASDNPESLTNINKGHTLDLHSGLTDMEMLTRLIKDNKESISCFTEIEEYPILTRIGDAIVVEAQKVAAWACSKRNEFTDPREYNRLVLNVDLNYDEPVGIGFNKDLEKIITDHVKVVLQRDMSGENNFGFYVLTAYADLDKGFPTGERYEKEDILRNPNKLTVLEKVKYGLKESQVFTKIDTDRYTGKHELRIFKPIEKTENYVIYMNEDDYRILHRTENHNERITKSQLKELCPEMYNTLEKAELYKEIAILSQSDKQKKISVQKTCDFER